MFWSEIWKTTAHGKRFGKGDKVKIHRFNGLEAIIGDLIKVRRLLILSTMLEICLQS
jgi:hypothetical protein